MMGWCPVCRNPHRIDEACWFTSLQFRGIVGTRRGRAWWWITRHVREMTGKGR